MPSNALADLETFGLGLESFRSQPIHTLIVHFQSGNAAPQIHR